MPAMSFFDVVATWASSMRYVDSMAIVSFQVNRLTLEVWYSQSDLTTPFAFLMGGDNDSMREVDIVSLQHLENLLRVLDLNSK
jgi:hypothetical protein